MEVEPFHEISHVRMMIDVPAVGHIDLIQTRVDGFLRIRSAIRRKVGGGADRVALPTAVFLPLFLCQPRCSPQPFLPIYCRLRPALFVCDINSANVMSKRRCLCASWFTDNLGTEAPDTPKRSNLTSEVIIKNLRTMFKRVPRTSRRACSLSISIYRVDSCWPTYVVLWSRLLHMVLVVII